MAAHTCTGMALLRQSPYRQTALAFLGSLGLLFALRVWLFLRYPQEFASLEPTEVLMAFWMGFRVDVATLFTFLALPTLMLLFPYKGVLHRRYRQVMAALWGVMLACI